MISSAFHFKLNEQNKNLTFFSFLNIKTSKRLLFLVSFIVKKCFIFNFFLKYQKNSKDSNYLNKKSNNNKNENK